MSARSQVSTPASARSLARAVVLALGLATALVPGARAQVAMWEMLPLFPQRSQTRFSAVDFLRGEGSAADDPAADSLVIFGSYGVFLYNPSGATGAAGDNGEWGTWHRLCTAAGSTCSAVADGLVTAAGSIVIGNQFLSRATNRGRSWTYQIEGYGPFPFLIVAAVARRAGWGSGAPRRGR